MGDKENPRWVKILELMIQAAIAIASWIMALK